MKLGVRRFISFTGILLLLGLSGCAGYKAKPLRLLSTKSTVKNFSTDVPTVFFDYQVFDKKDCKKYLYHNIGAKGYKAIQITLTNNTNHLIKFSPETFSLPVVDCQEVAKVVRHNIPLRSAIYAGSSIAPLALGISYACLFIHVVCPCCLVGPLAPGIILGPVIAASGILDGIISTNANQRMKKDFERKSLYEQVVEPGSTINGLIFVKQEDFKEDFNFLVTDMSSNKQYELNTKKKLHRIDS